MTGRIVLTGLGAVSTFGIGVAALRDAVRGGRSGIKPIRSFDAAPYASGFAAEVDLRPDDDACLGFACQAAAEAWAAAGAPGGGRGRTAILVGTSAGPRTTEGMPDDDPRRAALTHSHAAVAVAVAAHLRIRGPALTVSTACASGNVALAFASDLLRGGHADVVLVGGAEAMSERRFAGFHALGALAPQACAPFSTPVGMTLGEGAGFVVLEREEHAERRGAAVRATLLGAGLSADGWHATAPDPGGEGMARAIARALADAGLSADDVGYYNAHGTGTEANDSAEWNAVRRVFGARGSRGASAASARCR